MSPPHSRLQSIDALRGLVMLFMLLDHVRETFYLHRQVGDPMDAMSVAPELFFTRLLSALCAPAFIFLTGLSAWLYSQKHTRRDTSLFLLKRGLFLLLLELTLVNLAWNGTLLPTTLWLQVIWCIGICMIVLAAALHLPRGLLVGLGALIVAGHNLLDPWVLSTDSPWFTPWAILHQRDFIELGGGIRARTTYPVLPWIGVILLGWSVGPWFAQGVPTVRRSRLLMRWGGGLLLAFVGVRYLNVYGELPWVATGDALRTTMSFLSARKYPPSLMFLLPTLGLCLLLLALLERYQRRAWVPLLALFGAAPMFFYLLHLYMLKALYLIAVALWGLNQGAYFGFDQVSGVWLCSLVLALVLYCPTRWFAALKQRRRDVAWLKYF
ncbi:MAG: heparan-alpha-glucosaminide N-acetyltransferase domain-containing protein [Pseudomonas sp.]